MPMASAGLREIPQEDSSADTSAGEPREIPSSRSPAGPLGMPLSGPRDATTDSPGPFVLEGSGSADEAQELESRSRTYEAADVLDVPIGSASDTPSDGSSGLPIGDPSAASGFRGETVRGGTPPAGGSDADPFEVHATADSAEEDAQPDPLEGGVAAHPAEGSTMPDPTQEHGTAYPSVREIAVDPPHEDLTANAAEGNQAADLAEEDAVDDPAENATTRRSAEETVVAGSPEEDADTEEDGTEGGVTTPGVTAESVAGGGGAADGGATIGGAEESGATEGGAAGVVAESLEGASGDRGGERRSADGSSALDWGGSLLGGGAEERQRGSARKGGRGGRRAGSKGRRSSGRSGLPDGPDEESQAASAPPADPESVARAIVLRLLTMAPKTRAQLAEALRKRDVPEEAADAVLDRFSELGLINDEAFAEAWVDSRHHGRGLAKRALAAELRHRGVDNDTVKEAVERLDSDQEAETARRLVDRKLASTRSLDPQTRTRRLAGMLARKGYSSGLAYRVIREALDEEGIDVEGDGFP
ncbi:recombination regulator RecX [Nonomuraea bangladeshensis]|uniref:recombination regulator RecX n=1 Tax=Nonomuraea bangladeshensis TaxID=404385 RepID=UPI0031D5E420